MPINKSLWPSTSYRWCWVTRISLFLMALLAAWYCAPRVATVYSLTQTQHRDPIASGIAHLNVVWTGRSYAYVVWPMPGATGITLIDTGGDLQARALREALFQGGATPDDVTTILCTHGHEDHTAGLDHFPQATVYASFADTPLLRGDIGPKNTWMRLVMRLNPRQHHRRPITPLAPGQQLTAGGHLFEVFALPGHTMGSLVFAWHTGIFGGDAVCACSAQGGNIHSHADITADYPQWMQKVLRRLIKKDVGWIANGHLGLSRICL